MRKITAITLQNEMKKKLKSVNDLQKRESLVRTFGYPARASATAPRTCGCPRVAT